nr:hypothetical protein Iba_chr04dCG17230 [Ipomoea batatas]
MRYIMAACHPYLSIDFSICLRVVFLEVLELADWSTQEILAKEWNTMGDSNSF